MTGVPQGGASEFGGTPKEVRRTRNREANDRLRNLRATGDEEQTAITDEDADAIWEGFNP